MRRRASIFLPSWVDLCGSDRHGPTAARLPVDSVRWNLERWRGGGVLLLQDHLRIPSRRILLGEGDVFAMRCDARNDGLPREASREQAESFGLFGEQFGGEPREKNYFLGEIAAGDIGAAGVGPAFGEGGVDCVEHGFEALGKLLALGNVEGNAGLADFVFRANEPLAHRGG